MPPTTCLGIDPIELAHALGKIAVGRLGQQMVVVVHQTPGVAKPVEVSDDLREGDQKNARVFVALEDVLASITPRGDVVERVRKIDA